MSQSGAWTEPAPPIGPSFRGRSSRRRQGFGVLALVSALVGASLVALLLVARTGAPDSPAVGAPPDADPGVAERYGELPLSFVRNAGQADPAVRYYAQGAGSGFFFTREGATIALADGDDTAQLSLDFLGANPDVSISARERLPGEVSYLSHDDPASWHRGLATHEELVYRDLWPGVDMAIRGDGQKLKYEFAVAPGSSAQDVRLAYGDAERLALGEGGALRVHTSSGVLRDSAPRSYQVIDGRRVPVESRYTLQGHNSYGFAVGGAYDPSRPLVIDPGIAYSTYLGGDPDDRPDDGLDIAVGADGAAYIAGQTFSPDFPTTAAAHDETLAGLNDAFVTKLEPSGSSLAYSTFLGGSRFEAGTGIAVDDDGNAYVTGRTNSVNFPTTTGAFEETADENFSAAFVTKLNGSGSAPVYSTYLGGASAGGEEDTSIAVDPLGSAYVIGETDAEDFPTTPGAHDQALGGFRDAFATKLEPSGSTLAYSTYLGGGAGESVGGTAIDGAGNAYVTGNTGSTDFPTTPGAADQIKDGGSDAFATKLDASGAALVYSTYVGGGSGEFASDIAVDGTGAGYLTGFTTSSDFPLAPGAPDQTLAGGVDSFVTKLAPSGSAFAYSTYLGGSSGEEGGDVAVDGPGSAYVTGTTESTDFPTTTGSHDQTLGGGADAYVTEIHPSGAAFDYSSYLGGSVGEVGAGLAIDAEGMVYVTGRTNSHDYPTTPGAPDQTLGGESDAFVTKLDPVAEGPDANDTASEDLPPEGGTVATNSEATPDDPVGTSVTSPVGGTVSISEGDTTEPPPLGYSFVGQQVDITAPVASATDPLVLSFAVDASVLPPGADAASLQVFRNGSPVADCAGPAGDAAPDPCVSARQSLAGGDVSLTVLTSQASRWNFGLHDPYPFTGFFAPLSKPPPALNAAKAGSSVPVRFGLGGDRGLGVLASGYPRSHRIDCATGESLGTGAPTDGKLNYDRRAGEYVYTWKTSKAWDGGPEGPCRQLDVLLIDGTHHRANLQYR